MQTFAPRGKIHGPILPQFVLETSISFGAKVMYALLCNYASDNDRCWPSQATLATRLSCSVSSVKKYLGELVGIKLIDVRREQYRSSVYYMLRPETVSAVNHDVAAPAPHEPKPARHEATVGCRQSDSACPQPNSGYLNTLNKQEERNTPPLPPVQPEPPQVTAPPARPALGGGDSFAHDFEKAWEFYPRKEAKGLARSAWLHLQREGQLPTLTKLESSIRHFMASENWQREQGRFVPQMSNWLRGQRWLDDAVTAAAKEAEAAQHAADALQAMQRRKEPENPHRTKSARRCARSLMPLPNDSNFMKSPGSGRWPLVCGCTCTRNTVRPCLLTYPTTISLEFLTFCKPSSGAAKKRHGECLLYRNAHLTTCCGLSPHHILPNLCPAVLSCRITLCFHDSPRLRP